MQRLRPSGGERVNDSKDEDVGLTSGEAVHLLTSAATNTLVVGRERQGDTTSRVHEGEREMLQTQKKQDLRVSDEWKEGGKTAAVDESRMPNVRHSFLLLLFPLLMQRL